MPGSGLLAFVALPLVVSGLVVLLGRRHLADATQLRGLWLIPLALAGTILAGALRRATHLDDVVLNRGLSCLVLAACVLFALVNRPRVGGLLRAGVLLTTAGAGLNALATAVYGSMPVLGASARVLGEELPRGSHPDARYVTAHGSQTFAVLVGDVIPIPGLGAVISIGDVLLLPGSSILLAACLARLLHEDPVVAEPRASPTVVEEPGPDGPGPR
jgi:hypothetical protein